MSLPVTPGVGTTVLSPATPPATVTDWGFPWQRRCIDWPPDRGVTLKSVQSTSQGEVSPFLFKLVSNSLQEIPVVGSPKAFRTRPGFQGSSENRAGQLELKIRVQFTDVG